MLLAHAKRPPSLVPAGSSAPRRQEASETETPPASCPSSTASGGRGGSRLPGSLLAMSSRRCLFANRAQTPRASRPSAGQDGSPGAPTASPRPGAHTGADRPPAAPAPRPQPPLLCRPVRVPSRFTAAGPRAARPTSPRSVWGSTRAPGSRRPGRDRCRQSCRPPDHTAGALPGGSVCPLRTRFWLSQLGVLPAPGGGQGCCSTAHNAQGGPRTRSVCS